MLDHSEAPAIGKATVAAENTVRESAASRTARSDRLRWKKELLLAAMPKTHAFRM